MWHLLCAWIHAFLGGLDVFQWGSLNTVPKLSRATDLSGAPDDFTEQVSWPIRQATEYQAYPFDL